MKTAGFSSRSVHAGEKSDPRGDSLTTPVFNTATFWFRNSAELRHYQEGTLARDEYGRYSNPTWRAVERKVANLDAAEGAVLFGSGMSAITTTFLALLQRGSHVVLTSDCYRRTRQFCAEFLTRMDVKTTVIEPASLDALEVAVRNGAAVFFTELPTNPYLRVIDLPKAAAIAHEHGATVIVDATFATPVNHRPLEYGADLVLHSATKYLGGHNDLLAGIACGGGAILETVRKAVGVLGGISNASTAYLLLRGLKTLSLRVARQNENGARIARMLEAHPRVRRVHYPGLPSHPDHAAAARLMTGFGGVVSFEIDGDFDAAVRFVDSCRIPYIAPSLGGVESLIEMPVLMSYWDTPPDERLRYGITDSLVRLSCGIEDGDDLAADLEQALQAV